MHHRSFFLGWLGTFTASLQATPIVSLTNTDHVYGLTPHIEVLADTQKQWTIDDVQRPEVARFFQSTPQESLEYGFTQTRYWLRFQVIEHTTSPENWYLELAYPHLDFVDLYTPKPTGGYTVRHQGDHLPFKQREVNYRNFVFHLQPEKSATPQTYYISVETSGSVRMPLSIWSATRFAEKNNLEEELLGMYYGAMLVMFFYHILLFIGVRDRIYLDYSILIAIYTLFQFTLNGLAFQYLWQDKIWWANNSLPFLISGALLAALQFTRTFLKTKNRLQRLDRTILLFVGLTVLSMGISLLVPYVWAIRIATILTCLLIGTILGMVLVYAIRGDRAARHYALANLFFLTGASILGLLSLGWAPQSFVTEWMFQLGSILQVLLFSFGVADMFNVIKAEKDRSNTTILEMQQTENQRLEQQVQGRTSELQKANHEITYLNQELRGILTETQIKEQIIRRKNQVFQYLLATSTAVLQSSSLEVLFHSALEQMENLFEPLKFGLILDGSRPHIIECAAFPHIPQTEQDLILKYNRTLLQEDIQFLMDAASGTSLFLPEEASSSKMLWKVLPMIGPEYKVMGKLIIKGLLPEPEDEKIINLFLEQIAGLAQNQLLTQELEKLACTDALTETFNRGFFDKTCQKAIINARQSEHIVFSIIMIDINGLKRINDIFGHHKGDQLIIRVADMLRSVCRKSDVLSRIGGDEFAILCQTSGYEMTQGLVIRIREQEQKMALSMVSSSGIHEDISLCISIGLASSEDTDPEQVFEVADQRMYEDKQAYYQRNHCVVGLESK